jgi:hypothetical protein
MQDNSILGYSTDMNINEDYQIEGVQSLGYYGFRDFMSLGYSCDFDLNTFLLTGAAVGGSLSRPGWQSDGNNNINSAGLYTFTILNVHSLEVLSTIIGAKYSGGSLTVAVGSLMKQSTKWKARQLLPGLNIS